MENPTLRYYREQMEKALYLQQETALKAKETKNKVTLDFLKKEATQHSQRAEYYVRRMIDHGGTGLAVKVSGEVYIEQPGKGRSKVRVVKKFQMILNCPSIEDAKETFEAQVLNTMEFLTETIQYRTIPLKRLILL